MLVSFLPRNVPFGSPEHELSLSPSGSASSGLTLSRGDVGLIEQVDEPLDPVDEDVAAGR
jgi:hypothetical protein